jgi:hypothetical protein
VTGVDEGMFFQLLLGESLRQHSRPGRRRPKSRR